MDGEDKRDCAICLANIDGNDKVSCIQFTRNSAKPFEIEVVEILALVCVFIYNFRQFTVTP